MLDPEITEAVENLVAVLDKRYSGKLSDTVAPAGAVVTRLASKLFFVERKDGRPDDGSPVQVGDRIHLDITPFGTDGKEIGPGDPRIATLTRPGPTPAHHPKVPSLQMRWTVDGKMNFDSIDEEDHFAIQSYNAPGFGRDNDNGFTPVFQLERQAGPGTRTAVFWALIEAENNGGFYVESPKISLQID